MHHNKEHLTWDNCPRIAALHPISKRTHRRHFHGDHAEEESTEEKKGSTDKIASLLGLRQLQISVNHRHSKTANSKSRGRMVTRGPS